VRIKGSVVDTAVLASSQIHARLIFQYIFGNNNLLSTPTIATNEDKQIKLIDEFVKPLTPQQTKIDSLKKQKDNIGNQLKAERKRQTIQKAQQTISKAMRNY